MSENPNQTNEEIVDEITKNLEETLSVENVIEPKCENEEETNFESCEDSEEEEESKEKDLDDIIDEEALKQLEATLSEEEIEIRKKEALELKKRGNEEYKQQEYFKSVETYTEALRLCPTKYTTERSIFYANRAASKINIDRKKSAIEDCSKSIELNEKYVRAYLRRAKLYEETDSLDESLEDYKKVLEFDPGCMEALNACQRLPPKIAEKNAKLKEEMMGKLKDLGNLILRPFGLSTENFKLQQNESGGYSINFNQNQGGQT